MQENYLSVAQVNTYIKNIFEAEFMLQNISVYGEVSSYNISNGIAYFNIKDDNNLLQCVLFGANKFEVPNIGDMVLVTGSVSYYQKGGRLSFNATKIAPYGRGLLYEKFLELKNKLEKLGYFDIERKKPLPDRVNKIGVVTSPTGAVIQDIIDVSTRRNNSVNIILYPVKVQGVGAEFEIAKGIEFFSNYDVDVIIVARGGGSIEDLQPFNTEVVANAVYNCKKPLVSAVGHETDFTIIDFISDLRAPTPSAAAELVVRSKIDDYNEMVKLITRIENTLKIQYKNYYNAVEYGINKIENSVVIRLAQQQNTLNIVENILNSNIDKVLDRFNNSVTSILNGLDKMNPNALLGRGYTKIERSGQKIDSIKKLKINDEINLRLLDGVIDAKVTKIKESN